MKKLPIDVSDFENLISAGYLYVDKTRHIYDLVTATSRYYFISRPRRFGKSLFISTLYHLFLGNQDLFKDLWIATSDYSWDEHPIITLDFSDLDVDSVDALKNSLSWNLTTIANNYNIDISAAPSPGTKLKYLVQQLAEKGKVVILIDEYDFPILENLEDKELSTKIRKVLKNFFTVLKSLDKHLRAIFITGVTKFSKTSLFSGLNNLNDITMKPISATLFGYTNHEIEELFKPYIAEYAQANGTSIPHVFKEMKLWYNGYRFSDALAYVYNPYSILYYLYDKRRKNYWLESGTPTFLIKVLGNQYSSLDNIQQVELSSESLGLVEIEDIPVITLLYQTGYLTIADYDKKTGKYKLDYPNEEVRESFTKYLLAAFSRTNIQTVETNVSKLKSAIKADNVPLFCKILQSMFAHIPYNLHIGEERYYHSMFQFLGILLSLELESEVPTDKGRIDLILKTKTHIYIFEVKLNKPPNQALKQINDKKYYEKYVTDNRTIVLVGLAFNLDKNKLDISCDYQTL